ncbi:Polyphenol oxidase II, chloroplastic, partial [Dichanthelium oligosanthes]
MNGCMASACATSSPLAPVARAASTPPACPSKKTAATGCRRRSVSCRATGGGRGDDGGLWLPRRDMLSALSGVAAGLAGYQGLASAAVEGCLRGDKVDEKLVRCTDTDPKTGLPCPPPLPVPIVDFRPEGKVKRVRQPAHLLSREYQEKYKEAIAKMKALPPEHPLSFVAQAAIHQAYCDSHYRWNDPAKDTSFDVHFSWLFAPWHRMYIYFYERALGQLIGDDTFAVPYWNWDAPSGMVVPALFRDSFANPLHNRNRDPEHLDALVDLDYIGTLNSGKVPPPIPFNEPQDKKYKEAVNKNLCTVFQQQIREGQGARAFLGEKLCSKFKVGENELVGCQGSLERMAHTALHAWVGNPGSRVVGQDGVAHPNADMGFLGSAGRDPLFYSHHANVDRMWHIWSTKLGGKGFDDPEWLDASFVFYDDVENPRRVRIKFRDVLDARNLGYTYDEEAEKDLPWINCKLTPLVPHGKDAPPRPSTRKAAPVFPVTLRKDQ